jgi:tetratricopeptide (TPR) repeat protein
MGAALLSAVPALGHPVRSEAQQQFAFGVQMAEKGSWREAAFRFERAVRSDPNNPLGHNNLGVALESIGEFERALASYKKAAELDPKNLKIRENMDRLQAYLSSRTIPAKLMPDPNTPAGAQGEPPKPPAAAPPPPPPPAAPDPNAPPPATSGGGHPDPGGLDAG